MYSSIVEEMLARYSQSGDSSSNSTNQLLPAALCQNKLECQPIVQDTELDLRASDSASSDPSSYASSSRSSALLTDVELGLGEENQEVEEVIRDAPLRRQDRNHDVLRSQWGLAAPRNFGRVMPGVYRSGFPQSENINFLKTLNLKTILTLVSGPYPQQLERFVDESGIQHIRINIEPNKDPLVVVSPLNMLTALSVVLDRVNHPILIHCNKGKHRTGCVVGCFRKVLGVDARAISEEYNYYAGAKARPLDERFIDSFDSRAILWLARENNFLLGMEPVHESPISSLIVSTRLKT